MPTTDLPGPHERMAQQQRILNQRAIPPRRRQRLDRDLIDVTARVVWERDGVEYVDTVARDWVGRTVMVDISDRRLPVRGVWLDAADITRR